MVTVTNTTTLAALVASKHRTFAGIESLSKRIERLPHEVARDVVDLELSPLGRTFRQQIPAMFDPLSDPGLKLLPMPEVMEHEHVWGFAGDAMSVLDTIPGAARKVGLWDRTRCTNPSYICCREDGCDAGFVKACNSSDESVCVPCEARYRRQVRTVVREPLFVAPKGSAFLLTITAPGAYRQHCWAHKYRKRNNRTNKTEWLPSYTCFETHPDDAHDLCDCSNHALDSKAEIADWNMSAVARWNELITDLRRSVEGFAEVEYFRAVEAQERGAIHFHVVLMNRGKRVNMTSATLEKIRRYALRHQFGHQIDLQEIGSSRDDMVKAARYVSKYINKAKKDGNAAILLPKSTTGLTGVAPESAPQLVDITGVDLATGELFEMPVAVAQSDDEPSPSDLWDVDRSALRAGHHRARRPYVCRLWYASQGWGLSLGAVRIIQAVYASDGPQAARDLQDRLFILAGLDPNPVD